MTTRIGMITPSSNTCLEPRTSALLADIGGVTAHFARTPVTRIDLSDASNAQFDTEAMVTAATLLHDARVDAVVWNGTSGSWLGIDHDRAICAAITESTSLPATTSTLAMFDAARALGISRIGLVTPYTDDVVDAIRSVYATAGIDVVTERHSDRADNHSFAEIAGGTVDDMVRAVARGTDAVLIVCTNLDGTRSPLLESELGVPVIDSILASAWAGIRLTDSHFTAAGWGTLLRHGSLRAHLQSTIDDLRHATSGDRTTLRIDLPEAALTVQTAAAESCAAGVLPIRSDTSLPQRRLATVEWLESNRKPLVQNDFHLPPQAPQALRDVYGVAAQVLVPIEITTAMTGWISVHSLHERVWTPDDVAAIEAAAVTITELVRTHQENQ